MLLCVYKFLPSRAGGELRGAADAAQHVARAEAGGGAAHTRDGERRRPVPPLGGARGSRAGTLHYSDQVSAFQDYQHVFTASR